VHQVWTILVTGMWKPLIDTSVREYEFGRARPYGYAYTWRQAE
jgi:hypothetical protein